MITEMCVEVYYTGTANCSQVEGEMCGIPVNFEFLPWERRHPCFINATIPSSKADKRFSWVVAQMEIQ